MVEGFLFVCFFVFPEETQILYCMNTAYPASSIFTICYQSLSLPHRLDEALSDCILAQEHMRANAVIDYKQLGLRYRLYSWQVRTPIVLPLQHLHHCYIHMWSFARRHNNINYLEKLHGFMT